MPNFTLPLPKRGAIWITIVVFLYLFNIVVVLLLGSAGISISASDAISLLSADFLAMLVLLEIFPFEKVPDMIIVDVGQAHTYKVIHPQGEFNIRLLLVGAGNKAGHFAKAAKDVRMSLLLDKPFVSFGVYAALPWQDYPEQTIRVKETIDPTSPESISQALEKTLFRKHKEDFNPSEAVFAIVAYGLSTTGGIYSATKWPVRLDVEVANQKGLVSVPIALRLTSPDIALPPTSRQFIITGKTWEDAAINPQGVSVADSPLRIMLEKS